MNTTTATAAERNLTYYLIAKFTTDTPILKEEAEPFIKLAIKELGERSDVQLFQVGEFFDG